MGDLVKAFERFITRDLMYVIGGASVIVAVLHVFGRIPAELGGWQGLYAAGLGYVVGYVLQEVSSVVGIVSTKATKPMPATARWVYRRFEGQTWPDDLGIVPAEFTKAKLKIDSTGSPRIQARLERIIGLKQVGTTIGPAMLLVALILAIGLLVGFTWFDVVLSGSALVIGVILVELGWLKNGQELLYVRDCAESLEAGSEELGREAERAALEA